jgi:hypothetical protein
MEQRRKDNEPARTNAELRAIRNHVGPGALDSSSEIEPRINRDGLIQFVTPTEVFTLAGDFAVRLRRRPDATEELSFWRNGVEI